MQILLLFILFTITFHALIFYFFPLFYFAQGGCLTLVTAAILSTLRTFLMLRTSPASGYTLVTVCTETNILNLFEGFYMFVIIGTVCINKMVYVNLKNVIVDICLFISCIIYT